METITSYIDNLFRGYKDTPQVRKAKEELLGIMEDKYHELKANGKSEHEAIGIVISEFGSMDEISFELGLDETKGKSPSGDAEQDFAEEKHISVEEANQYIKAKEAFGIKIGIGVALCILSPVASVIFTSLHEGGLLPERLSDTLGAIFLFAMIAAAVGIFIVNGIANSKYDDFEKQTIWLDSKTRAALTEQQDAFRPVFGLKIATGVILCIVSAIPTIIVTAIFDGTTPWIGELSSIGLLLFVAIAVFLFVSAGIKKGAYDMLLKKNKNLSYAAAKEKDKKLSIISSIYWPVVTIIYLGTSFVTSKWGSTWIIWPIAAILFGGISACVTLLSEK